MRSLASVLARRSCMRVTGDGGGPARLAPGPSRRQLVTTDKQVSGTPIKIENLAADIMRRRAEYEAERGPLETLTTLGTRRTPSPRTFLMAIEGY